MSNASKVSTELKSVLSGLALLGAMKAVEAAKPHAEKWWNDNALPFIESNVDSALNKVAKARKADR